MRDSRLPDGARPVGAATDTTAQPASDPFARPAPARLSWNRIGPVLAVAAGGIVGGTARYGVSEAVPRDDGDFPWATFTVNITGAFLLAVLLVLILDLWRPHRYVRPFLCVGALGSFTTFSSLTVEVDRLASDGALGVAAGYLGLTVVVGFAAAALGLTLGHRVTRREPHPDAAAEEAG